MENNKMIQLNGELVPDNEMANIFLESLIGNKWEGATFQFYTEDKEKKDKSGDKNAQWKHLQPPFDFGFMKTKQDQGSGVWVMVNEGDGQGRTAKNVVKIRALFIDLDGSPWEPAAERLKPHMRVESSPGRWHLYWLVGDCTLDEFTPIQKAIARRFNGDPACHDLPRVLRVPGFYHLKGEPVMTKLIEVNNFPRYTTQEVIDGLGLKIVENDVSAQTQVVQQVEHKPSDVYQYTIKKTGEMINLKQWAAANPNFDIVKAMNPEFIRGKAEKGKQHILCPFADEHTDTSQDMSTFVANADEKNPSWTIHCMHGHCVDRDRLAFFKVMLEKGWLQESILGIKILELKQPSWIKFPIVKITQAQEWANLTPEERRIALDLQYYTWRSGIGTFEDDDWKIAKFLGVKENEWLNYRTILIKSGWLLEENGRLYNEISRNEFVTAQYAYSKQSAGGKKGGITTQQNRRENKTYN